MIGPRNYLITAPTDAFTTTALVKTALGITSTSQDSMIAAAISATVGVLDPASGGWLGRALRPQTWELRLPAFYRSCSQRYTDRPVDAIDLPYPTVTAVTSIKYDDAGGTERTLVANTDYRVFGLNGIRRAYVAPAYNGIWPQARYDNEAVRIRYVAGYALTPNDLMPAAITQAVTLAVRMLLSNVERNLFTSMDRVEGVGEKRYIVSDVANKMIEQASASLLGPYRVYG